MQIPVGILLVLLIATPAAGEQIAEIEFFGYEGIDVVKMRTLLPVRRGDAFSDQTKDLIRETVVRTIGKQPTDVAAICCDENGNRMLFIGLPGGSYKSVAYRPEPAGRDRLPLLVMDLQARLDRALHNAVLKGGDIVREDDSRGYALVNDPAARELQLAVRRWALKRERELVRVLELSSAVEHRRVASAALGYARQSHRQILALARAARDPDDDVRNNATRALAVLVQSGSKLAAEIPPAAFIEMLSSGIWSDRNKATALLDGLTAGRDPALLQTIGSEALDSLIEMARWHRPGHAFSARKILGRVAGLPEDRLNDLAWNGPVEAIVEAARRR